MKKLAVLAALAVSACTAGETITLRNQAGITATCGPYAGFGARDEEMAFQRLRDCVTDFQRQGYERVSTPAK